ncbi:NAD-dependent epimerase/dehydratase family protein, partial [bacterium]|nr:NAD-dependent epimerase/dehydratase family protein [bacterium]
MIVVRLEIYLGELTDWQQALVGVDTVIHLAGRVHVMDSRWSLPCAWIPAFAGMTRVAGMTRGGNDKLHAFRKVNVLGTERLARMAAKAGVKRFIFISSVKVNGEGVRDSSACGLRMTEGVRDSSACGLRMTEGVSGCNDGGLRLPYTEKDVPAPQDAYGVSKMEAEQVLAFVAKETGLEVVILRLPLVYGRGVKANFKSLIKLVSSGMPLPFKGINNRRSFLYVGNLVDAIGVCVEHPKAAGETFLVSDGQDVSTPELIRMIAGEMKNRGGEYFKTRGRV